VTAIKEENSVLSAELSEYVEIGKVTKKVIAKTDLYKAALSEKYTSFPRLQSIKSNLPGDVLLYKVQITKLSGTITVISGRPFSISQFLTNYANSNEVSELILTVASFDTKLGVYNSSMEVIFK